MKRICRLLSVLLVLSLILTAAGCGGQKEKPAENKDKKSGGAAETINLTIASGPAGGTWYPLGGAVAKIIQNNIPGAVVSVQQGGGEANALGVDKGMYDIGITYSHTAAEALAGKENFKEPLKNIAGLAGLYPSALQMVVRADSDIKQIEDLKGKRISPGPKGLSGETMTRLVLQVHGLKFEDMAKVERVSYSDSASLMQDRQIDMYSPITTWPAPSIQEVAQADGVRLLPLRPEKFEELKKLNPGYTYITIKAGTYKGMEEDTPCLGSNAILIIRKDMPEDLAYKIAKALYENLDELKSVHKSLEYMTKDTIAKDLGVPLHPGVEKYYREVGIIK
ncbi:TAXI family TRAP transporter solute-binding subunit [Desulfofundulus sp. TPOSR]|uniref:TAXI family TRAP transporter solute-binding subunit n=1 Tax=Desulfofundulus sp. TPOSR TaxID=2714340 RepID=UPI00140776BB|nr:TAXI family TRAP transporter solute-binding subunit [Desulfofundulus sp. TPOSR]NHM26396.1 TAXI family TRAP transporter solute-binding subunit [Desulfofundulus sp. TPOSR]